MNLPEGGASRARLGAPHLSTMAMRSSREGGEEAFVSGALMMGEGAYVRCRRLVALEMDSKKVRGSQCDFDFGTHRTESSLASATVTT